MLHKSLFLNSLKKTFATSTTNPLSVTLTTPHATLLKDIPVTQVNLSSTDGDMGILSSHVPSISQLKPSVLEFINPNHKFFVSGGFAVMNPDSSLNINAIEAVALTELDYDATRKNLAEANSVIASASALEADKLQAKIQLEVFEAILATQKN